MPPTNSPRTAVVTGGASGIGAAIAHRLASDGHCVATLDITPAEGGRCYRVDVTDRAQIDDALADIHTRFGPLTILINASGRASNPPEYLKEPGMQGISRPESIADRSVIRSCDERG
jgi:NAD(P)-dependent dehydrogenase (short-subunit alcohol dehydrogenase family)